MTLTHMALRWVHISMGLVGILSGTAALTFRKGSRPHQLVGHVFFVSMLIMASMGATLAMTHAPNRGNGMGDRPPPAGGDGAPRDRAGAARCDRGERGVHVRHHGGARADQHARQVSS